MSARVIELVVPDDARGARLDRFVSGAMAAHASAPSRSEVQRWIEGGAVTVEGASAKAADKLRPGARIHVRPLPPLRSSAAPDPSVPFEVVFSDEFLVVVFKPAGIVVHPARGHPSGTLVNGLIARGLFSPALLGDAGDAEEDGEEGALRPGIVHRIDKGTSGLLVVARTPSAREGLKTQFQAHSIEREYWALCRGIVRAQTFDTLHGRSPVDRKRFSSKVRLGKRAVTHVAPLQTWGGRVTLVSCRLETGRTHQIRVHLGDAGFGLLGDEAYGGRPKDPELKEIAAALGRPALHARVLGFEHPVTGEPLRFEAPPPEDFEAALERASLLGPS